MFRQTNHRTQQLQCIFKTKSENIISKQQRKLNQICQMRSQDGLALESQLLHKFKPVLQIDMFQNQKKLDDKCISNLSNALVLCQPQKDLSIDIAKKWHLDDSEITDQGILNLSQSIFKLTDMNQLNLALQGWGYWNQKITNLSLNYLAKALLMKDQLTEVKLDLNMWAYENTCITDEGALSLLNGLSELTKLGKLEINMKGWGDANQFLTDATVIGLSKSLSKLQNLSEIKLILWENISSAAIKQLNKVLSQLEHLTRIDLQFESSSSIQRNYSHNRNANLAKIKLNALQKRQLLFQTEAVTTTLREILQISKIWDIALKL